LIHESTIHCQSELREIFQASAGGVVCLRLRFEPPDFDRLRDDDSTVAVLLRAADDDDDDDDVTLAFFFLSEPRLLERRFFRRFFRLLVLRARAEVRVPDEVGTALSSRRKPLP